MRELTLKPIELGQGVVFLGTHDERFVGGAQERFDHVRRESDRSMLFAFQVADAPPGFWYEVTRFRFLQPNPGAWGPQDPSRTLDDPPEDEPARRGFAMSILMLGFAASIAV